MPTPLPAAPPSLVRARHRDRATERGSEAARRRIQAGCARSVIARLGAAFATASIAAALLQPALGAAGAGAALAAAPPARDAPVSLVPGISFGWTAPGTEALLAFQIRAPEGGLERVTGVQLPARQLTVSGYRFDGEAGQLLLRVRAVRAGDVPARKLQLELRYAPPLTLPLRAAEVMALASGSGPFVLRQWASDDGAGLYAAFALVNGAADPVTVRSLRYAPPRLGRGLVLIGTGDPAGFQGWKDGVLERTVRAFGAYLRARGHDPRAPARTPAPRALAFPLSGPLAGDRWRGSEALETTVPPGQALFVAITPAAFDAYVDDLAITAYPVLGYETRDGCCRLQGIAAPIVHVVAPATGRHR